MCIACIPGIVCDKGSPLATSQRSINFISSDCDLLIRAPSDRKFLFSVCESISAVISTACAWCMIIPCINWTSAAEVGGNVAVVEGGSSRVGWPGAPGWTTTGGLGSACWAASDTDTKQTRMLARAATAIKQRGFIDFETAVWMASPYTTAPLCATSVVSVSLCLIV